MRPIIRSAATRGSLLKRIKDADDQESWREFYNTYREAIFTAATEAGLRSHEADEVVQESFIAVSKHIGRFNYNPGKGKFRAWLSRVVSSSIVNQFRQRQAPIEKHRRERSRPDCDDSTRTGTIERISDPAGQALETLWQQEWDKDLMEAAFQRVKHQVSARHIQIFDYYVRKEWPVSRVAKALNVSAAQVYIAKLRVGRLIKKELAALAKKSD